MTAFATVEDLQALGIPSKAVADWPAKASSDLELCRIDQVLFGRAMTRDGRRVPPEEWGRVWPPVSSGVSFNFGYDPLLFIGRAAKEGP